MVTHPVALTNFANCPLVTSVFTPPLAREAPNRIMGRGRGFPTVRWSPTPMIAAARASGVPLRPLSDNTNSCIRKEVSTLDQG
jgi:hypothetical protein